MRLVPAAKYRRKRRKGFFEEEEAKSGGNTFSGATTFCQLEVSTNHHFFPLAVSSI
jgi:hypothetical protein